MLKLFVDDLRNVYTLDDEGVPCFVENPDEWTQARTVTDAIRILATTEVSHVILDHDIMIVNPPKDGLATSPGYSAETFEPVARYIALMPNPPQVSFITANPAGQKRMEEILADGQKRREEVQKSIRHTAEFAAKTHHALQQFTKLCSERHIDRPT